MANGQTPFQRIVGDFVADPIAVFGLMLLTTIMLIAIFAPLISPQNP
jgi:peptide/nickel transport system permease protein